MRLLPSEVVVFKYSFFASSDMALHFFSLILFVKLYLVLWKTKKRAAVAIKPKFTQLPTWKRGASLASVKGLVRYCWYTMIKKDTYGRFESLGHRRYWQHQ